MDDFANRTIIKVSHQDELIFKSAGAKERRITGFGGDDVIDHEMPNELITATIGYKGSAAFQLNPEGRRVNLSVKIVKGSNDDKWFTSLWWDSASKFVNVPFIDLEYKQKIRVNGQIIVKTYFFKDGTIGNPTLFGTQSSTGSETPFVKHNFIFLNSEKPSFDNDPSEEAIQQEIIARLDNIPE